MIILEALEFINEIEDNYPVKDWRINEIDLWPYFRMKAIHEAVYRDVFKGVNHVEGRHGYFNQLYNLLGATWYSVVDYAHSETKHNADVVFLGDNVTRTIKVATGEIACQNLDAIKCGLQQRGYSVYSMERITSSVLKFPRFTKSDLMYVWDELKLKLQSRFRQYDLEIKLPCFEEVEAFLCTKNGFSCISKQELIRVGAVMDLYVKYFYDVLNIVNAKLGVATCWYTYIQMAFMCACRKKGIPCIDIQHGLAGADNHEAYIRWNNIPSAGYNTMPTHFWCWSLADVEAVKEWYNCCNDIFGGAFLCGNPVYGLSVYENSKYWLHKFKNIKIKEMMPVLLSLQAGVNLPEWVICYIKKTENKIQWFVRQHPVRDLVQEQIIGSLRGLDNVEIDFSSVCPLTTLLQCVSFHITSHSAVVSDAAVIGLKSAVFTDLGKQLFCNRIASGECFYVYDENGLDNIIENMARECNKGGLRVGVDEGIKELVRILGN